MSVSKSLSNVFKYSQELSFDDDSHLVIISDCHRGTGTWSDDFLNNQNLFYAALTYYFDNNFTYIELGDGDELWGNRHYNAILAAHGDSFQLMSQFYRENRFYMLFGNHDKVKKYVGKTCFQCENKDPLDERTRYSLFPGMHVHEGLILKYKNTNDSIFLVHGHQGDLINDHLWRLSRFLVRYIWKRLELTGFHDPTSAAKNYQQQNKTEKRLIRWSNEHQQMLIAGHTHRPTFPKPGHSLYFNDGSCVHPRSITAIEIEGGTIALVKWSVSTRSDRTMYVHRQTLDGPILLAHYFQHAQPAARENL